MAPYLKGNQDRGNRRITTEGPKGSPCLALGAKGGALRGEKRGSPGGPKVKEVINEENANKSNKTKKKEE